MQAYIDFPVINAYNNLGVPELSIIVLLVLILFGPGKLPGVMKALGDGVKQFKDAASGDNPKKTDHKIE